MSIEHRPPVTVHTDATGAIWRTPALTSPGLDRMTIAANEHVGFVRAEDVAVIAADPITRLTPLLVRCGGCRFTAPAQDVAHLIAIITRDRAANPEHGDHVRDVALLADTVGQIRGGR